MVGAREKSVSPELIFCAARRFQSDATRLPSPRGTVCCALNNAFAHPSFQLFAQHNDLDLFPICMKRKTNSKPMATIPIVTQPGTSYAKAYELSARIPRKLKIDGARRPEELDVSHTALKSAVVAHPPFGRQRTRPASSSSKLVGFARRSSTVRELQPKFQTTGML